MIAITDNNFIALPVRWLIGLFMGALVVFTVMNLPANLLVQNLKNSGIHYRSISGSVWHSELQSVTIGGEHWSNLQVSLIKLPLLRGSVRASFVASGDNKSVSGDIEILDNQKLRLTSFTGSAPIFLSRENLTFNSIMNVSTDYLEVNTSGECQDGTFELNSKLPRTILPNFPMDMPILSGQGECAGGRIAVFARSAGEDIELSLKGEFAETTSSLILQVILPEALERNINVINELTANGFIKSGPGWQMTLEAS